MVNIITVKNYNGAEANAYLGMFDGKNDGGGWDGKTQAYDFTIGSSGDKSGVVMQCHVCEPEPDASPATAPSPRSLTSAAARPPAARSRPPAGSIMINPGDTSNVNGCNFYPNYGTPSAGVNLQLDPGEPAEQQPATEQLQAVVERLALQLAPLNYLVTPNERTSLFVQGHYDLADNLTFNTMGMFTNRVSQQQLAPTTIAIGAGGYYRQRPAHRYLSPEPLQPVRQGHRPPPAATGQFGSGLLHGRHLR